MIKELTAPKDWHELVQVSRQKPVFIFKHSPRCALCEDKHVLYEAFAQAKPNVHLALVDVRKAREVSQLIAAESGVDHESPQLLLLRNGSIVGHWDHHEITTEALNSALI